jgi:hypothetical protein
MTIKVSLSQTWEVPMSRSVTVNAPNASAKSSIPSPQDRTRGLPEGRTIVAMQLFVAACFVYLAVAMTYLTSLAGINSGGSMTLQGENHAGDVMAGNPGAMVVPSL